MTIDSGSGPFLVTAPNTGSEVWSGTAPVSWNVAGSSSSPVNATHVDILLSTDGGSTFPITLLSNTPNDGAETILVPVAQTTTARVKIVAAGNVFFDISDNDFTVDEEGGLAISLPSGAPEVVSPGQPTAFDVEIIETGENLVPGSATLHYRYDGGTYLTSPLVYQSGDLFEATLPAASCDDSPEFYLSAEGDGGTTVYSPGNAPATVYSAAVGTLSIIFEDNFETDQDWTATDSATLDDGTWELGDPLNNDRGDPPADHDGSGQCYLTRNDPDDTNSDVDDGTTTVESPVMDMSAGGTISYAYWLNDIPAGPLGAEDSMEVEIATNVAGDNWQTLRTYTTASAAWRTDTIEVSPGGTASATLRIRFSASDLSPGDVVEGGLDAFLASGLSCDDAPTCADGILNQDEERIDCGGPNCDACECTADATCTDGEYCTGTKTCDAFGICQDGSDPCLATHWCYESGASCILYGDADFEPDGDVDLED
ncbi:MAG: hypothetical protein GY842_28405, partial [bacterium]|nr:hypothetical protein [bacterium]